MKKPLIESLPGTDFSSLSLSRHDGGGAEQLEGVPPRHGAPLAGHGVGLGVAALAHDLHVRGVAAEEGVQRTLAVTTGETALELFFHFHSLQTLISIGFLFPCCI